MLVRLLADATTADPLLEWSTRAGALGVLAWNVYMFFTGRLHGDKEVQRLITERDRALDIVYEQAQATRAAVAALEATPGAKP